MANDNEISAMSAIVEALSGLEDSTRSRVILWAASRYGIQELSTGPRHATGSVATSAPSDHPDFASLFDAAHPRTDAEKALVAGYWFQVAQGSGDLDAQTLNTALKHLGHGVSNITDALSMLKNRKPAYVLQLQKMGKSKQARKKYKITAAGIKRVQAMVAGAAEEQEDE